MGQPLIRDLAFSDRIVAALAGVDDLTAEVLVVDVAPRDHDGLRAIGTAADAALVRPVNLRLGKVESVGEGRTGWETRDLAIGPLRHTSTIGERYDASVFEGQRPPSLSPGHSATYSEVCR